MITFEQSLLMVLNSKIFWACLILITLYLIFFKKFLGFMGELWVKQELKKLDKDKYIILNNLLLKDNEGLIHQIDHLVISQYGLFVIETKNYEGLVAGKSYYDELTLYLGSNKYKINNPIHQNYGHIKCLQDILELDNFAYYNVVCFANRTKVKIDDKKDNEIICNLDFLNNEILSKKSIKIDTDINDIKSIILSKNIVDKAEKNKHVENVKVIKREKDEKINNNICPKCGGKLVERKGKYGHFVGCSNYPKCKYTR